ncbi:MAG TPA: hypothetical protein VGM81_26155 [Burkholderiaceae bacterium]
MSRRLALSGCLLALSCVAAIAFAGELERKDREPDLVARGRYLAQIGVCAACHTPAALPSGDLQSLETTQLRANPNWTAYLDKNKALAGGVPFIIRLPGAAHGTVITRNITPDVQTGIGSWSALDIVRALKYGVRPNGEALFLFPPHAYYKNMADFDAYALAAYLKSLPAVTNRIKPRELPFPVAPIPADTVSRLGYAPAGATVERGRYLTSALVGCVECHSHRLADGALREWAGGHPDSKTTGMFRLGPDLPLTQDEKGIAAWPYPGYAALLSPNLTVFGIGGPEEHTSPEALKRAIREGVPVPDARGLRRRTGSLAYTMPWQFYAEMSEDDVSAIVKVMKTMPYRDADRDAYRGPRLIYFGDDWKRAFRFHYGEEPLFIDELTFGKR